MSSSQIAADAMQVSQQLDTHTTNPVQVWHMAVVAPTLNANGMDLETFDGSLLMMHRENRSGVWICAGCSHECCWSAALLSGRSSPLV
jgi:hypothetical protein